MMDNCCAPQWADLACSPQVLSDSYFEVEHEVHEPLIHFKPASNLNLSCKKENATEIFRGETKFDDSLEPVQNECTSVAYFIPHDSKKQPVNEMEEKKNSNNATRDLKSNRKSDKIRQTWNISVTELTTVCKKPTMRFKVNTSVPERIRNNICTSKVKNPIVNKYSSKNNQPVHADKQNKNMQHVTSTKDNNKLTVESRDNQSPKSIESDVSVKRLSYKIVAVKKRRQSDMFKAKRRTSGKSCHKVLTCQYRRTSLMRYRRCSNQFISMAEAVSRFQNGTPQRFRTISSKNLKAGTLMKLKQEPLKLTNPISPALRSKQRSRPTTVLPQEEREKLELEEMKKHQIKANPVPVNILKAPCTLKKVAKKPTTVAEEFRLTQCKKTRHTTGPQLSSRSVIETKSNGCKNPAPMTRSTSASNVAVKKDNACTESSDKNQKPSTNALPFSFVARNKQYLMKKEERLKNLQDQETNKIKSEFHARPAPKFSKPANVVKDRGEKKRIVPCPFSFEARDKTLAKKKEELVKHMQEQSKPVFHANPVPSFKPVTVHGLSKENIHSKEKPIISSKKLAPRQTKSCVDQENRQPNIVTNIAADSRIRNTKQPVQESHKTQLANSAKQSNVADAKNVKSKIVQRSKFELNTDKRAKERNEFDEKLKKREEEQKSKRQEEEKMKLLQEKLERIELRKLTETKAIRMPIFKPLNIMKSTKPPTSPRSPAWGNRNKLRSVS